MLIIATIWVASMLKAAIRADPPIWVITSATEANTTMGIKLVITAVIVKNREFSALNSSFNTFEYSSIMPTAVPHRIAKNMT